MRDDPGATQRLGRSQEPRRPLRLLLTVADGAHAFEALRDVLLVAQRSPDREAFGIPGERGCPFAPVQGQLSQMVEGPGDAALVAELSRDGEALLQEGLSRLDVALVESQIAEVVERGADAL